MSIGIVSLALDHNPCDSVRRRDFFLHMNVFKRTRKLKQRPTVFKGAERLLFFILHLYHSLSNAVQWL